MLHRTCFDISNTTIQDSSSPSDNSSRAYLWVAILALLCRLVSPDDSADSGAGWKARSRSTDDDLRGACDRRIEGPGGGTSLPVRLDTFPVSPRNRRLVASLVSCRAPSTLGLFPMLPRVDFRVLLNSEAGNSTGKSTAPAGIGISLPSSSASREVLATDLKGVCRACSFLKPFTKEPPDRREMAGASNRSSLVLI